MYEYDFSSPAYRNMFYGAFYDSTLIPPTGLSSSQDLDTIPSFILAEYDQDLRLLLRGSYEGLKVL